MCRFPVLSVRGPKGRCGRFLVLSVRGHRGWRVHVPSPQCACPQGQACTGSQSSVCVAPGAGVYRFLGLSVRCHRGRRVQVPSLQCAWPQGRACAGS